MKTRTASIVFLSTILMVVANFIIIDIVLADTTLFNKQEKKKDGETTVIGKGTMVQKRDGSAEITVKIEVSKSGTSGVGKGHVILVLYDQNLNEIIHIGESETVGAVVLKGYAEKSDHKSITILKPLADRVAACALLVEISDTNIIKDLQKQAQKTLEDLAKEALKMAKIPSLAGMKVGGNGVSMPGILGQLIRIK